MKRFLWLAAGLCCAGACPARAADAASRLVSHRAVYDLSLKSTAGGASSVVHAAGQLLYTVRKVCGIWKTETVFSLDVSYELSGVDTTHWKQTTSESPDGCHFDFDVYTFVRGKDVRELSGTARCEGKKKHVLLSYPLKSEASFPPNVAFPMQQTEALLKAAASGKKSLSSYVYDGTRLEGLHLMHAMISDRPPSSGRAAEVSGDVDLLKGRSYWFNVAFYNDMGLGGTDDGRPFYEAGLRYYENGLSDGIIQDFGTYRLQSILKDVRKLDDIPCPSEKKGSPLKKTEKRVIK